MHNVQHKSLSPDTVYNHFEGDDLCCKIPNDISIYTNDLVIDDVPANMWARTVIDQKIKFEHLCWE